jgi:hypothetical protein
MLITSLDQPEWHRDGNDATSRPAISSTSDTSSNKKEGKDVSNNSTEVANDKRRDDHGKKGDDFPDNYLFAHHCR